jgi:hypothetical protein
MAADDETPAKAEAPASPPAAGSTASEFRAVADALRSRVDLFGKTLAAVATLGTTAVGLSKIGDLFPDQGEHLLVLLACLGLLGAALAAVYVAVRLMKVAGPVFMSPDIDAGTELDEAERNAVRPVYEAAARRFGYSSVVGLQERERSLRKAASRATDADERARRTALADEVKDAIDQALAQAQVVTVRGRALRAVSEREAWYAYVGVLVGLIVFALCADGISSTRSDHIAEAKACGDARKAGATATELGRAKDVCDAAAEEPATPPPPPSEAEARAQVLAKLVEAQEACAALIQKAGDDKSGPLAAADCDPVRQAVSSMDPASKP